MHAVGWVRGRSGFGRVISCAVVAATLGLCASAPEPVFAAPDDPFYTSDFSGPPGPEWSTQQVTVSPGGERFLGRFGNTTAALELTGLPEHERIEIELDVYILDSMDGNDTGPGSGEEEDGVANPDVFTYTADGAVVKRTTFGNRHPQAFPGDYPGASNPPKTGVTATDSLGFDEDTTFRVRLSFEHSSDSLRFAASASGLDDLDDESWGIDNLSVSATSSCPGLLADPDANLIEGTEGDDSLVGTPGNDVICGLGGNDDIEGRGGMDVIFSGSGDDISEGGGGNDTIIGGSGDDQLVGGRGNDTLQESDSRGDRNVLDGGPGEDDMRAGSGLNTFRGGGQVDTMLGGDQIDRMFGEGGGDRLEGGGAEDVLRGGARTDRIGGGPDSDRLFGGNGGDLLGGDGGGDKLFGGRQGDDLDGGTGRDRFAGQRGPDTLLARDGRVDRRIDGGRGVDLASFDRVERRKLRSIEQT